MPIDVKCPQCGSELEAPDNAAGKKVQCPDCGTRIPVAAAAIQPPPRAERPARKDEEIQEERLPHSRSGEEELQDEDRPRRRRRDEDEDVEDERPRRRRRRDDYEDEGIGTLIPYKNGKALAAYYCGVFSLIPCVAVILGPLAFIFGLQGLRFAREHPRARGAGHAWAGIILGSLTTLAHLALILIIVIAAVASKH